MGYILFSQLPIATDVASDDYYAVLDSSERILKRAVVTHASEDTTFGASTTEKYGHSKIVDNLNATHLNEGEALSAHQGNILAEDLGSIESTPSAAYHHDEHDFFMFMGQFVECLHEIEVGDMITVGMNVRSVSIGRILKEFKESFQAGVDEIYEACTKAGITPAASTPEDIANAITTAAGGTAREADVVSGKTFLAGNQWRSGSIASKSGNVGTGTPTGNNQINVNVPAGYYSANSAYIVCKGQSAYSAGQEAGYTAGYTAGYDRGTSLQLTKAIGVQVGTGAASGYLRLNLNLQNEYVYPPGSAQTSYVDVPYNTLSPTPSNPTYFPITVGYKGMHF